MNINFELGLWIAPLILTVFAFFIALRYEEPKLNYLNIDFIGAIRLCAALIFSMATWLIYLVFKAI